MKRFAVWLVLACAGLPAQTKKVVIADASPERVRELQSVSPQVRIVSVPRAAVMSEIADADGFIGEIRPEEVKAGKKLKWVQCPSAGVERILLGPKGDALRASNIVLTNNRIVQGPEIADHAFAMLLYMTRRLDLFIGHPLVTRTDPYPSVELPGKTAVVIGVGGIGVQIAVRAAAFGMKVIGVDPEDKPYMPFLARTVKADRLNDVLPEADVVFVSAPHTKESHKMVGAAQFDLMKRGAYFIVVSRGGLYDTNALVKAIDSRKLAGAGLDVTDPEPLPEDHPLRKFSNVIITPHVAGMSDHINERMTGTFKENLRRFANGEPLVNVVDKDKGY
ncbi:MAG: D-2-hydroxyacid dehydrogenase [Acidobacteria bacterium]|nr:D-2-hydroxyacid dehydrogenase [Acidobacteriota bacterium]